MIRHQDGCSALLRPIFRPLSLRNGGNSWFQGESNLQGRRTHFDFFGSTDSRRYSHRPRAVQRTRQVPTRRPPGGCAGHEPRLETFFKYKDRH